MCTYRIKCVVKEDSITYIPQKRILNLFIFGIWSSLYEKNDYNIKFFKAKYATVTEAHKRINEDIAERKAKEIKEVEYIAFP